MKKILLTMARTGYLRKKDGKPQFLDEEKYF